MPSGFSLAKTVNSWSTDHFSQFRCLVHNVIKLTSVYNWRYRVDLWENFTYVYEIYFLFIFLKISLALSTWCKTSSFSIAIILKHNLFAFDDATTTKFHSSQFEFVHRSKVCWPSFFSIFLSQSIKSQWNRIKCLVLIVSNISCSFKFS